MQFDLLVKNTTQENYFLRHLLLPLPLHPLPLLKLLIHLHPPLPLYLVYYLILFLLMLLQAVYHSVNSLNLNFSQPLANLLQILFAMPVSPPRDLPIPQPTLRLPHFPRLLPLFSLLLLLQLLPHTPVILVTHLSIPKLQAQFHTDLRDICYR